MLSRQLTTRPLPAAPLPVSYCRRSCGFNLWFSYLNSYVSDFMSHLKVIHIQAHGPQQLRQRLSGHDPR